MVDMYLKNGKINKYLSSVAIRRILSRISLLKFEKVYVRVEYGKKENHLGKKVDFYNDGFYTDKKEAANAIRDFWIEE